MRKLIKRKSIATYPTDADMFPIGDILTFLEDSMVAGATHFWFNDQDYYLESFVASEQTKEEELMEKNRIRIQNIEMKNDYELPW